MSGFDEGWGETYMIQSVAAHVANSPDVSAIDRREYLRERTATIASVGSAFPETAY